MIFLRLFAGCFLQLAPYAALCSFPFCAYYRFSKRKTVLLTFAVMAGSAGVFAAASVSLSRMISDRTVLFQAVNGVFMACLLPCFLWYIFSIRAVREKKVFVFAFSLLSALSINSVCNLFFNLYLNIPTGGLPYSGASLWITFVVSALVLPVLVLILKYFYLPVAESMTAKESCFLARLSLLLFAVFSAGFSFISYRHLLDNPMTVFLFFALLFSVFVYYVLYFKMFYYAHERFVAQENYLQMQYEMQLLTAQYQRTQENIEASRRMRHDIRHHLLALQGLLSRGDVQAATEYIRKNIRVMSEHEILTFSENQIVNVLFSHYYFLARESAIRLTARIALPVTLDIDDPDLSVLIGNLLENALEAASEAPAERRYIRLNMRCDGNILVLASDNGFSGSVLVEDGQYRSTKEGHAGIGLKSIAQIAEKYRGGFEFWHDESEFHVSVMLQLKAPHKKYP